MLDPFYFHNSHKYILSISCTCSFSLFFEEEVSDCLGPFLFHLLMLISGSFFEQQVSDGLDLLFVISSLHGLDLFVDAGDEQCGREWGISPDVWDGVDLHGAERGTVVWLWGDLYHGTVWWGDQYRLRLYRNSIVQRRIQRFLQKGVSERPQWIALSLLVLYKVWC